MRRLFGVLLVLLIALVAEKGQADWSKLTPGEAEVERLVLNQARGKPESRGSRPSDQRRRYWLDEAMDEHGESVGQADVGAEGSAWRDPSINIDADWKSALEDDLDAPRPFKGLSAGDVEMLEKVHSDYRMGAGDKIEIYALNNEEITREYVLGPDGKIAIPLLGVVDLKGTTREEAAERITSLLRPHYREPDVTVMVTQYNNNRIYVLGQLRRPGAFTFEGPANLLGAIAQAWGLTENADLRGCTIIRGKGTIIEVDLYALLREGNQNLNVPLIPEDVVYVKDNEEHTFYVVGEVKNPGVYPLGKQMDVVRAISTAGGATVEGDLGKIRVIRRTQGRASVFEVDGNKILNGQWDDRGLDLRYGDIVYLPRTGMAKFNYALSSIGPTLSTILLGTSVTGALTTAK